MIFDSFIVMVGSALLPGSAIVVHVDGIVQFKVGPPGGHKRRWSSDNTDIIEIDPYSGRGVAKAEGKTDIIYMGVGTSLIKVNVIKVDNIDKASEISTFTNIQTHPLYKQEYKVDFRVFAGETELKSFSNEGDVVNNNLQFKCESDYPEWVEVSGEIDDKIPRCIVQLKQNYPSNRVISMVSLT